VAEKKMEKKCIICDYDEERVGGKTIKLNCGCYMCDECLLQGYAIKHKHKLANKKMDYSDLDKRFTPYYESG